MLITRPRRAGGVTVWRWTLALDPNRMLKAPRAIRSGISTIQLDANGMLNSRMLKPAAPMKMRCRVTLLRLAIIRADPTEPIAMDEVRMPKLAASAWSTYWAISGRIVWKL